MDSTTSFLRNRYWVLRHGKSIPNEKGLIVSSMGKWDFARVSIGIRRSEPSKFGWTIVPKGPKELKENEIPVEDVRICYSPFSRTIHTANVVASVLNIPFEGSQCKGIEELRERYFGPPFELKSHDKYAEIWALDEKDPFMRPECGESVDDVASRLAKGVATMEAQLQGCTILVVGHGDPLQILQTVLNAAKQQTETDCSDLESRIRAVRVAPILSQHRKFALLTGELRAVI